MRNRVSSAQPAQRIEPLRGAGQPLGVQKSLSYLMDADTYTGRVLYVTFRTSADLGRWVPSPLRQVDPGVAFLKIYQLRRRPSAGVVRPPTFSQYHEACVTVLAELPGDPTPRHYNLFMWVDRDWAMYKAREVLGWPKKLASIDVSWTFPNGERHDRDAGSNRYEVRVSRWGFPIIRVTAELGGAPESALPAFSGFYSVRTIVSPDGNPSAGIAEVLQISPTDGWSGPKTFGTAAIEWGQAPDEEVDLLGDVEVTACALMDTGWALPAWPARRVADLDVPVIASSDCR